MAYFKRKAASRKNKKKIRLARAKKSKRTPSESTQPPQIGHFTARDGLGNVRIFSRVLSAEDVLRLCEGRTVRVEVDQDNPRATVWHPDGIAVYGVDGKPRKVT